MMVCKMDFSFKKWPFLVCQISPVFFCSQELVDSNIQPDPFFNPGDFRWPKGRKNVYINPAINDIHVDVRTKQFGIHYLPLFARGFDMSQVTFAIVDFVDFVEPTNRPSDPSASLELVKQRSFLWFVIKKRCDFRKKTTKQKQKKISFVAFQKLYSSKNWPP